MHRSPLWTGTRSPQRKSATARWRGAGTRRAAHGSRAEECITMTKPLDSP